MEINQTWDNEEWQRLDQLWNGWKQKYGEGPLNLWLEGRMEPDMKKEIKPLAVDDLERLGFSVTEIGWLVWYKDRYTISDPEQVGAENRRLEFMRWLVERERIAGDGVGVLGFLDLDKL